MAASIFTFDPDPPRVSSPWSTPPPGSRSGGSIPQDSKAASAHANPDASLKISRLTDVGYSSITKLEAEPQEGPTEYKLHLLLRRRRSFKSTSTGPHVSGSLRRLDIPVSSTGRTVSEPALLSATPPPNSSTQSRQHRLEQLTTQLLWRLQQSCSYHIASSKAPVLPQFPDEANLSDPALPQRLLPGLEETKGALYEIGVADDGTFVGLAEDEMEESLNNLRAMAGSLGCRVEVLRMVQVGECEWFDDMAQTSDPSQCIKQGRLFVAEALVRPYQHLIPQTSGDVQGTSKHPSESASDLLPSASITPEALNSPEQLRVSFTGATMSGKSSLLGCLSTATLDNGRGKSRLSLLKHRHEIVSGVTSSITQELIGYHDVLDQDNDKVSSQVISYGAGNVSSWVDIHAAASGRLVFLSDSAGHPRFRRTTVRGLVGWDPHWTLLCIPADNTEDSTGRVGASPSSQDVLGPAAVDLDLSQAHLQLCLSLGLPLIVAITKYDLATKFGLRQTLAKLLSAIKDTGRKPCILRTASDSVAEDDLNTISADHLEEAKSVVDSLGESPLAVVPIILTSSVKGTGITKLHAFLRELPLPLSQKPVQGSPHTLFYIEDVYSNVQATSTSTTNRPVVIGGILRHGHLRVGDELLLGPFLSDTASDDSDSGSGRGYTPPHRHKRGSPVPTSRSFPGALHNNNQSALRPASEWRRVRVTSLRNLRLPVEALWANQVGTVGVTPVDMPIQSPSIVRIRKGMVLANGTAHASKVVVVRFEGSHAASVTSMGVGNAVVLYVASVRASAKVVSVATEAKEPHAAEGQVSDEDEEDGGFGFGFDGDEDDGHDVGDSGPAIQSSTVTFQFIAAPEFVEIDAKALILPGGGPGLYGGTERGEKGVAGLEGFVGTVSEAY